MATFTPPTVNSRPGDSPFVPASRAGRRLFHLFGPFPVGQTVLRIDGVYLTFSSPSMAQVDSATEVYLGGHIYEVSGATVDALEAAGHSVDSNPYAFGYGDPY